MDTLRHITLIVLAALAVLSAVCTQSNTAEPFTDSRDGQTYRTVKIGKQRWMAENLNFVTHSSACYDNTDSNCVKYGRLYDWDDAMTACPAGWHLPSDAEWDRLAKTVGGGSDKDGNWVGAGDKLKSKSGWNDNGNGTDNYGFSALPGGEFGEHFGFAGDFGYWWTATEGGASYAWYRYMYFYLTDVRWYDTDKTRRFSVRCVRE